MSLMLSSNGEFVLGTGVGTVTRKISPSEKAYDQESYRGSPT